MTTSLQQFAAKIEADWAKVKTVAEADVKVIGTGLQSFLTAVEPEVLSTLLQLAADAGDDLITDPGTVFTSLLNQAEGLGSALWNELEPTAKTAALNTVVGIAQLNAAAAGVPAATVGTSAGA